MALLCYFHLELIEKDQKWTLVAWGAKEPDHASKEYQTSQAKRVKASYLLIFVTFIQNYVILIM